MSELAMQQPAPILPDHFRGVTKMVTLGYGQARKLELIHIDHFRGATKMVSARVTMVVSCLIPGEVASPGDQL